MSTYKEGNYMNFDFNTKNSGVIRGFFNNITACEKKSIAGTYSIYVSENDKCKEYKRTVRIDKNGKRFFTWNKEKIMFDEFICDTPEELVKKFKNKEDRLYGEHLCRTLLKYGMNSVRIKIRKNPMDVYDICGCRFGFENKLKNEEDGVWVEYKFVPEYLHTPERCYKLQLEPVDEEHIGVYARWDTYVDDMVYLIKVLDTEYDIIVNKAA